MMLHHIFFNYNKTFLKFLANSSIDFFTVQSHLFFINKISGVLKCNVGYSGLYVFLFPFFFFFFLLTKWVVNMVLLKQKRYHFVVIVITQKLSVIISNPTINWHLLSKKINKSLCVSCLLLSNSRNFCPNTIIV